MLAERRTPNKEPRSGYPNLSDRADILHNVEQFRPVLARAIARGRVALSQDRDGHEAWACLYSHRQLLEMFNRLRWSNATSFNADLAWLNTLEDEHIEDWQIFLPQLKSDEYKANVLGLGPFSLHRRAAPNGILEGRSTLFGRADAEKVARPPKPASKSRRGALLLYPMIAKDKAPRIVAGEVDPGEVVMAFRMVVPTAALPNDGPLVTFTTKDSSRPSAAIVDSPV
ncbi:hypothetical protein GCM10020001_034970 [Nonomuraea salmonea]